jgi:hypothetical protein
MPGGDPHVDPWTLGGARTDGLRPGFPGEGHLSSAVIGVPLQVIGLLADHGYDVDQIRLTAA